VFEGLCGGPFDLKTPQGVWGMLAVLLCCCVAVLLCCCVNRLAMLRVDLAQCLAGMFRMVEDEQTLCLAVFEE